jgi:hypothetical protein
MGAGVYKVTFAASKIGSYYYRIDSTTLTPIQSFEELITIIPPEIHGSTLGPAAYGNTLDDLFRAVATEVGDFKEVIATSSGTQNDFPDAKRLATIPARSLQGAALYIYGPQISANLGQDTRIADSSPTGKTLTLDPGFSNNVVEGDIGWITNLNGTGFWRNQYVNAINNAVLKAKGTRIPIDYDVGIPFDYTSPRVARPDQLITLYEVHAYNEDGVDYTIPMNDQNRESMYGWYYDYSSSEIVIGYHWASQIDGFTIRLMGGGRPAPMVNGDDYTTVDFEWIVNTAAATLKRGTGDQRELAPASMFDNRADLNILSTLTPLQPNEIALI